jgi:hypothetical protein
MHWNKAEIIHEEEEGRKKGYSRGHRLTEAVCELNRFNASYGLLNDVLLSCSETSNGNKIDE